MPLKISARNKSSAGNQKKSKAADAADHDGSPLKRRRSKKECAAENCTKWAVKGGVCVMHGAKVKRCSHDKCTNQAQKGGVCKKHRAKVAPPKPCRVPDCSSFGRHKGGVCKRHGAKIRLELFRCRFPNCTNQRSQRGGVCRRHKRYIPPLPQGNNKMLCALIGKDVYNQCNVSAVVEDCGDTELGDNSKDPGGEIDRHAYQKFANLRNNAEKDSSFGTSSQGQARMGEYGNYQKEQETLNAASAGDGQKDEGNSRREEVAQDDMLMQQDEEGRIGEKVKDTNYGSISNDVDKDFEIQRLTAELKKVEKEKNKLLSELKAKSDDMEDLKRENESLRHQLELGKNLNEQ